LARVGANASSDGRALSVSKKISELIVAIACSTCGHLSRAFVGAPGGAGAQLLTKGKGSFPGKRSFNSDWTELLLSRRSARKQLRK